MKKGKGDVYYGMFLLMLFTFIIGMFVATDKAFRTWHYGVIASFFVTYLIYTIWSVRKL